MVDITASDVREAADADASDPGYSDSALAFEISQAETIVNEDLAPHTTASDGRLSIVAALIAAAYADDDGNGPVSSVSQGSASVSYAPNSESALTYWRRAEQMDPTGRLADLAKPSASISVPDAR